jgi:hypothetical protein
MSGYGTFEGDKADGRLPKGGLGLRSSVLLKASLCSLAIIGFCLFALLVK